MLLHIIRKSTAIYRRDALVFLIREEESTVNYICDINYSVEKGQALYYCNP